jgi:hypothetical protein
LKYGLHCKGGSAMTGTDSNVVFVFAEGFGNDAVSDFDANPAGAQDFLDLTVSMGTEQPFADANAPVNLSITSGAAAAVVTDSQGAAANNETGAVPADNTPGAGHISDFVIF